MASGGEFDHSINIRKEDDHSMAIRNLLATIQTGDTANSGGTNDCVAQLLAAAVAQFGNNSSATSNSDMAATNPQVSMNSCDGANISAEQNLEFNPIVTDDYELEGQDELVETTVEVPTTVKHKPICIKFPVELRKRIITMRKEGKKCVEVAKELNVSVSGAQKVWERFLATGTVHDRKPSTYAGRPRKYPQNQDTQPLDTPTYETNSDKDGVAGSSSANVACANNDSEATVIITYTGNTDVMVEGALDVPGATVEVVETDPHPVSISRACKQPPKGAPAYRQGLLLKLIQDCPLAMMREDLSLATDNSHLTNLSMSMNKPLYMEYVFGHPFGKVPLPCPFDGSPEEAKIILSDPTNPVGKELLAKLGYSTKVYFNACCKPSPLFDKSKLLSSLPFSLGPGFLAETMQAILQLLLNMCIDPIAAMERIPEGNGLVLSANTTGICKSQRFSSPAKLSDYWTQLHYYASLLDCCENFLSATKPSAPCLLCHPFESVVKTLEIQDDISDVNSIPLHDNQTVHGEEKAHQVEVHVLQSGQIEFSAPGTGSSVHCSTSSETLNCHSNTTHNVARTTALPSSSANNNYHPHQEPEEEQLLIAFREQKMSNQNERSQLTNVDTNTDVHSPSHSISPQTTQLSLIKEPPLIIRRNRHCAGNTTSATKIPTANQQNTSPAATNISDTTSELNSISGDMPKQPRRSSRRLSQRTNNAEEGITETYNLRHRQKSSNHPLPPTKRSRRSETPSLAALEVQSDLMANHPMQWSVEDVTQFIDTVPRCDYTQVFKDHEVDGESLLALDAEMMVKLMNIKAGPALRIHKKITELKKQNKETE